MIEMNCENVPNTIDESKSSYKCSRIPRRYLIAFLGFFGFLHVYLLRVNMSFAIVAMTSNNSRIDSNGTTHYNQDFNWDSKERGVVLSSFFYGYVATQIFGGYLAPIVGAGRLLCLSIFGTSLLALATPIIAFSGGRYALIAVRILQGLFQGVVFPSMHELSSHWAPPLERTKLMGIIYSGNHSGTFLTMAICGIIAERIGWEWMFYIFGGTGILWSAVWTWQVYESPSTDPHITVKEKEYITTSIGNVQQREKKFSDVPWRIIFSSMPIWAAIVAHTTQNSGFYTFLTQLPTFLKDVSGWSFDKMGLLAAVPYLFMAIVVQCQGQLADLLRTRFKIKTTTVRKVFTSGCYLVQIIFLLLTSQMTHSPAVAITCLTIAVSSGGFAAYSVNYLDLAPQYSSLTLGISNTIATIPGMVSPTITGFLVQNKLPSEWMTVFYIVSAVYVFGAIFYATFASGELQSWAKSESQEKMTNEVHAN